MPLIIRIDCAKVVAPFERPRLTAIANRDRKDMQQPRGINAETSGTA
jgi:hypothetical protein